MGTSPLHLAGEPVPWHLRKRGRPGVFSGVPNASWPSGKCSFPTVPCEAHFQVARSGGLQVPGHYWRETAGYRGTPDDVPQIEAPTLLLWAH